MRTTVVVLAVIDLVIGALLLIGARASGSAFEKNESPTTAALFGLALLVAWPLLLVWGLGETVLLKFGRWLMVPPKRVEKNP